MSGFFHGEFVIEDLEELQRVQSVMEASLWVHKNVLFWLIIKEDNMKGLDLFHHLEKFEKCFNTTFIALVSKRTMLWN